MQDNGEVTGSIRQDACVTHQFVKSAPQTSYHIERNRNMQAAYLFCMISKIKVSSVFIIQVHLFKHQAHMRHKINL